MCRVHRREQEAIPDVNRNGFCFTDGVGRISLEAAEEVCGLLSLAE